MNDHLQSTIHLSLNSLEITLIRTVKVGGGDSVAAPDDGAGLPTPCRPCVVQSGARSPRVYPTSLGLVASARGQGQAGASMARGRGCGKAYAWQHPPWGRGHRSWGSRLLLRGRGGTHGRRRRWRNEAQASGNWQRPVPFLQPDKVGDTSRRWWSIAAEDCSSLAAMFVRRRLIRL
jgi:hypothetical protein